MSSEQIKLKLINIEIPPDSNIIFGHSHFVKTVEDLYETLISSSTSLKFGIAFCEASQHRLIRSDGNDDDLINAAEQTAFNIGCGHCFVIIMKNGFPINILNQVKQVSEVCRIFCATANALQVIIGESSQGRGVLGVIDGETPLGIETDEDKKTRVEFLKQIGYKR